MKFTILFCYAFVAGTAIPTIFAPSFPAWQFRVGGCTVIQWLFFFFVLASGFAAFFHRKQQKIFYSDPAIEKKNFRCLVFAVFFLILSSLLLASANYYRAVNTSSPDHILNHLDQNISDRTLLRGTIVRDPDDRGHYTFIDIQPEEIVKFSRTEFEIDSAAPHAEFRTRVDRVIDGDTIEIFENPPAWLIPNAKAGRTVRLLGLNTPEIPHSHYNPQESGLEPEPGGIEAKNFLKKTIEGKRVLLKIARAEPQDQYGRWLALLYVPELKESINELLLKTKIAKVSFLSDAGFVHLKQNLPIKISAPTGIVRAKVYPSVGKELYGSLAYAQRVEICSPLLLPRPQTNPAGFNYSRYLLARNIYASTLPIKKGDDIHLLGSGKSNALITLSLNLKKKMLAVLRETMPYPESAFLGGVTLGLRGGVPEIVKKEFQATGVAHVLAVSGLHVGFVAILLTALSKVVRLPKKLEFLFVVLGLMVFAIITGASPATLRSALMFSIGQFFYTFRGFDIRTTTVLTIPLAAFILLLFDPLLLPDGSFVLSFMAVWSLAHLSGPVESLFRANALTRGFIFFPYFFLLTSLTLLSLFSISSQIEFFQKLSEIFKKIPLMHEWLPNYLSLLVWGYLIGAIIYFLFKWFKRIDLIESAYRGGGHILRGMMIFTCAQLAILIGMMWPLSAVYFQRFPISGSFANFLAIPLISFIVQYALVAIGLQLILSSIGLSWLGMKIAILLQGFNWTLCQGFLSMAKNWALYIPYPYVETIAPLQLSLYYGAVLIFIFHKKLLYGFQKIFYGLAISLKPRPLFLWAFSAFIAVILCAAGVFAYFSHKPQKLSITFFDCGQGNALLIHTPNKKAILIDGGWGAVKEEGHSTSAGWDFGESGIATALSKYEISSIDLLINTSPRPGNLSAIPYLLNNFSVKEVVIPYSPDMLLSKEKELIAYKEFLKVSGLTNVSYVDAYGQEEELDVPDKFEPYLKDALALYGQILRNSDLNVKTARAGEILYQETFQRKNLTVTVLHPKGEPKTEKRTYKKGDDPLGSRTIVLKLVYGDFSCLIPTQLSLKSLEGLLAKKGTGLDAELLLLPKNGHPFWNSEKFLESVKPKVGIVQYGYLPRAQLWLASARMKEWYLYTTEKRLREKNISCYRTDRLGAVVVESDGSPLNEMRDIRWILKKSNL